ncbi:hypothetical protein WPS_30460 [Vulcanimicrobium alpinum]|uniref:LigXa-like C-terminal domain-containing protein n=1 Tax=Vulcanimicrobium alpinum TaxID=3016050 RepID=A0AAN2CAK6_UNVUL|nr:hypothetical protein WPS_30460 [Vulcanimicrobium alpinum]
MGDLGPREHELPFPAFDWTSQPREQRAIVKIGIRANYLQAVEGAIDSAHSWFLHRGGWRDWEKRFDVSTDRSPKLETEDTPYGSASRPNGRTSRGTFASRCLPCRRRRSSRRH